MKKGIHIIALIMVLIFCSMDIMEIYAKEIQTSAIGVESSTEQETEEEKTAGQETEKTTEQETEKTTEQETEKAAEQETEKAAEQETEKTAEQKTEKAAEQETEKTTEQETEKETEENTKEEAIRVLMVGNSFTRRTSDGTTYAVGKTMEELAKAGGHNLSVTMLTYGAARLHFYAGQSESHLSYYEELLSLLMNEQWDYIIFQEYSTTPIEYFDTYTFPATEKLLQMVKQFQPQATPLLYMTPGYSNGNAVKVNGVSKVLTTAEHEELLAVAYQTLGNQLGIDVVPAGMHVMRANILYPQIPMVGPDLKHPTYAGYYLAACSFYHRIYGTVPDLHEAVLTDCDLTEEQLVLLAGLTADSLEMNQKNITLEVNENAALSVMLSSHVAESFAVTYKSFDTGIATVDESTGVVTAKGSGSTVIMATSADGLQTFCNVTVKQDEEVTRVLMVGNSFTRYKVDNVTYSVAEPLKELATAEGQHLSVTTLTHGSARLHFYAGQSESHLSYYRELLSLLINEQWDYIIFQEYSTTPIEYFDTYTYPATEKLLQMVKQLQPQAIPLLYMTPGYSNGNTVKVNGVSRVLTTAEHELLLAEAYQKLGNQLGIDVVPAGMHILRTNYVYPQIQTVGPDLKHPSYAGYYLAACSFYRRIYGTVPDPRKASLTNCNLTEEQLVSLAKLTGDSLGLNQKDITLKTKQTAGLTASLSNYSGRASNVVYKSFDTSIAEVNASTGVVTAKGGGSTVIVAATSDGLQAFCRVTVRIPLSFVRSYYLTGIGERMQILPQTNAASLKWSSSQKSVASVSSEGIVTVNASGRTVITVTNKEDSTDKASYTLYVELYAPTGLKAAATGNPAAGSAVGNLKISWSKTSGATGYEIYRSTSKSGTYELIGTSTTASYTDKTASVNQYYYYKVKATNEYSYCTSPLSASVARGIILKAPTVNAKIASKKYVKLTWKKNTKATGYVIYRSTKKNSGYKKIATVTSKSKVTYTDKTVKKNKTYYYRVKAYRKLDGKTFYGVKSLSAKIKVK